MAVTNTLVSDETKLGILAGAGASKHAKLPDMGELYDEMACWLDSEEKSEITEDERLLRWFFHSFLDNPHLREIPKNHRIEILLNMLESLGSGGQHLLHLLYHKSFIKTKEFTRLKETILNNAPQLALALKAYIRKRCMRFDVANAKRAWGPLLTSCLESVRRLEVFTTNYDAIIEAAGEHIVERDSSLELWDGFVNATWHPENERDFSGTGLCLRKLHGSVTWYVATEGKIGKYRYDMIPVDEDPDGNEPMLYPVPNKKFYYGIFLWNFRRFTEFLRQEARLVAIGYSFADEQITGPIMDALVRGTLDLLIVDPNAPELARGLHERCLAQIGIEDPGNMIDDHPNDTRVRDISRRIQSFRRTFPRKEIVQRVLRFQSEQSPVLV